MFPQQSPENTLFSKAIRNALVRETSASLKAQWWLSIQARDEAVTNTSLLIATGMIALQNNRKANRSQGATIIITTSKTGIAGG